jgi:hypothetical protein
VRDSSRLSDVLGFVSPTIADRRSSSSRQAVDRITSQRYLNHPVSIRYRWRLAVMTAPWAPRDPIRMASNVGLAGDLALRRVDC